MGVYPVTVSRLFSTCVSILTITGNDLFIQKDGEKLIEDVAAGCGGGKGSTVVVMHSVGPVVVDKWVNLAGVKAVIMANLPGQESGNAIADILLGIENPSGKLPYTIGKSLEDYGKGAKILYTPNGVVPQQNFKEGLYIDYRHFDKFGIEPTYEFGFGLSYTTFEYSNLVVNTVLPKSPLPSPRPSGTAPPEYESKLPEPTEALFPENFRKLKKFVYPYIDKLSDIKMGKYPYPDGYDIKQPFSQAGGGEGGNPDLWNVYATASVDVKNTGSRSGKEVVQLYVSFSDVQGSATNIDFPVNVLRGFEKPHLEADEEQTVRFDITRRDLSYWDVVQQNWVMPDEGKITIRIGSSSRDLKLSASY